MIASAACDETGDALARARVSWPGVELDGELFDAYLAERPEASHLEDLYLACACLQGEPVALATFEARVLREADPAVRRLVASHDVVAEVRQRVRTSLLVGHEPRIADYRGRGPLVSWVRIVAVRTALQLVRADRGEERRTAALAHEPTAPRLDPELELLEQRHQAVFRGALADALSDLSAHERNLLLLHVVEGVSLSQIGALHGVNKSTVSRWLARARATVEDGLRARLRAALGVHGRDVDSLLGVVRGGIELSVERLLR